MFLHPPRASPSSPACTEPAPLLDSPADFGQDMLSSIRGHLKVITKPHTPNSSHRDHRKRAGAKAERQMAFYLHRGFSQDREVHVLNDLRLEDPEQPGQDGSPSVCQIDHLLVHRWGMFIIESKSVSGEVRVRHDGSGGDEWSRVYSGGENGIPSPIQQAGRQGEFLRTFLQRHREQLRGRLPIGLRTVGKVAMGTDQRGFANMPIQLMIAISDNGRIKRLDGWKEPVEPFQVFVAKADLIPSKAEQELERHRAALNLFHKPDGKYGLWRMELEEGEGVAEFLAAQHVARGGNRPSTKEVAYADRGNESRVRKSEDGGARTSQTCQHCGSDDLTARWGRYEYHWRCGACERNTAMPVVCSHCGSKGSHGKGVRIRKKGGTYFRDCQKCGETETIWREA